MKRPKFTVTKIFLLLILLQSSPAAYAYVDPGTGMFLIQGLITAVVAVIAFIKNPWKSVKELVARLRKKSDA